MPVRRADVGASCVRFEPALRDVSRDSAPGGLSIETIEGFGPERTAFEQQLDALSLALPVPQRAEWQRSRGYSDTILLVACYTDGRIAGAQSAAISRSRALPGHRIYRIERLSAGQSVEVCARLLAAISQIAVRDPLCLRLVAEIFEPDRDAQQRLARHLSTAGFQRLERQRLYRSTLALDLKPSLAEVFSGLHPTARRHVRAAAKRGLELRAITDPVWTDQLRALVDESMVRTGGFATPTPWSQVIALSARWPDASRVVGLFDPRASRGSSLVAFAWGLAHGTYASYEAAGSHRRPELGSAPLGYAPMWELISWARERAGASWFDLGGVGSTPGSSRLAGITQFKRFFSRTILDVGEEWQMEPHAIRAAVAHAVSKTAVWITTPSQQRLRSPEPEAESSQTR